MRTVKAINPCEGVFFFKFYFMSFGSARAAGSKPAWRLGDRILAAPGINSQLMSELRDGGTWRRSAKGKNADLGGRRQKITCGLHVLGLGLCSSVCAG